MLWAHLGFSNLVCLVLIRSVLHSSFSSGYRRNKGRWGVLIVPDCINIRRNYGAEESLLDHSRKWIEKEYRDPRVHVSDLLDPRMAYWGRVKPRKLSDRLITTFLIGKVLHAIVICAVDGKPLDMASDEGSVYSKELDIVYSIDKIVKNEAAELKTTRSFYEPKKHKDVALYCEQLLCYMVARNQRRGHLWLKMLNLKDPKTGRTAPAYRCYTITISEAGLKQYREQMLDAKTAIQQALKKNDPSDLPLCRSFKCSADDCDWWDDCKPPGRWPRRRPSKGGWGEPDEELKVRPRGRRNERHTTRTGSRNARTKRSNARHNESSRSKGRRA